MKIAEILNLTSQSYSPVIEMEEKLQLLQELLPEMKQVITWTLKAVESHEYEEKAVQDLLTRLEELENE